MGGEGGFNAIYYSDAMDVYPDAVSPPGKTVSISGTLQMDEDRPEIVIRSPTQIKIEATVGLLRWSMTVSKRIGA